MDWAKFVKEYENGFARTKRMSWLAIARIKSRSCALKEYKYRPATTLEKWVARTEQMFAEKCLQSARVSMVSVRR